MKWIQQDNARKTAICALAVLLAGCGSETTKDLKTEATSVQTNSARVVQNQETTNTDIKSVTFLLGDEPQVLNDLICTKMGKDHLIIATSTDGDKILKIRLVTDTNSRMPQSFMYVINYPDKSTVAWTAPTIDIKRPDEKTVDISGMVTSVGRGLDDKGVYRVDPSLEPRKELPMQVSITCK